MHLQRIKLTNFRGFDTFEMTLDSKATILVGRNGSGKSSLLNAIEVSTSYLVAQILGRGDYGIELGLDDMRVNAKEGEITTIWNQPDFEQSVRFRATRDGDLELEWVFQGTRLQEPPLCVAFRIDRARSKIDKTRGDSTRASLKTKKPAWDDGINRDFHQFEHLLLWFREREDFENQERVQRKDFEFRDPALDCIRRSAASVLGEGYGFPRIDRSNGIRFVLQKNELELSAEQLSDGERGLLVIAATIARRLFLLDPKAEDPLSVSALILIDELELHLHPTWQREILPRLQSTFPKAQFVVSTHSAPVLSKVESHQVRILEDFRAYEVNEHVYGRDANALLCDVLGVAERPEEIRTKIGEISVLLDDNRLDEASKKLSELENIVGPTDSEVVRIRMMLDFLKRGDDEDVAREDS